MHICLLGCGADGARDPQPHHLALRAIWFAVEVVQRTPSRNTPVARPGACGSRDGGLPGVRAAGCPDEHVGWQRPCAGALVCAYGSVLVSRRPPLTAGLVGDGRMGARVARRPLGTLWPSSMMWSRASSRRPTGMILAVACLLPCEVVLASARRRCNTLPPVFASLVAIGGAVLSCIGMGPAAAIQAHRASFERCR